MICYLFPEPTYFFFSVDAPALLYYAQIPATLIALLFSFYAFWLGRQFLLNRLLLAISIFFSLWTVSTLIAWTNIHSDLIIFIWSFFNLILGLISIYCIYFIYVFLEKKDASGQLKGVFFLLLSPILLLSTTNYNLSGFNLTNCDAFEFEWLPFKAYGTFLGILAMVWILILLVRHYKLATQNFKKQIVLMGVGIELFLFSFFGMEFVATYLTKIGVLADSQLELYGLFGMVIFMIYITILMVRFSAFNIKLIATQALIWGLSILIGSQFFFIKTRINFFLTGITLVASVVFGHYLIKSVKREIEQREKIEKLAIDLEKANTKLQELDTLKSEFLSFASHQLRSPLTALHGYTSMLLEGDFGEMSGKVTSTVETIDKSSTSLIKIVNDFLNISRIEQGRMEYDFADFNLKELVEEVISEQRPNVEEKGLELSFNAEPAPSYLINADRGKLKQVIGNVLDNSIKYSPAGSIKVNLNRKNTSSIISIADTGIGIDPEEIPKLFSKFSRAKDANKTNVTGTGLGLYVAKQMIEAQKGKIWVESEGKGKGSTFFIEFEAK